MAFQPPLSNLSMSLIVARSKFVHIAKTLSQSSVRIDHHKKDGGMYILPECIASIMNKWPDKDDTKSNDEKF